MLKACPILFHLALRRPNLLNLRLKRRIIVVRYPCLQLLAQTLTHNVHEQLWMLDMFKSTWTALCIIVEQLFCQRMILCISIAERGIFGHSVRIEWLHGFTSLCLSCCWTEFSIVPSVRNASHLPGCSSDDLILICKHVSWPVRT